MSIEAMKLTDPHDHPEPHTMKWTQLEMDYINKRVEAAVRAAIEQAERQEPVATLFGSLPVYDVPPQREPVKFPTALRKMWSGTEVQAWLDENVNKEKNHE